MDIEEEFTASNDHTQIVKRKRTKRQRTGLVVTSSSSSGGGGGGGGDGCFSTPSPTTSSGFSANSEEDEDMANCLMLLSQSSAPTQHEGEKKVEKLSNRKFTGAAAATTRKGGFDVYECKTCNRTFPSFQALGGHRASHKKPKAVVLAPALVDEKKYPVDQSDYCEEELLDHQFDKISHYIQPISIQADNKAVTQSNNNNKAKIHECSICGSEFSSGQALGGHMRRHRTPLAATVPEQPRRILSLDLNLPAPEEDCRDSEFVFTPNHQQHNIVFSAPPLVDCHY